MEKEFGLHSPTDILVSKMYFTKTMDSKLPVDRKIELDFLSNTEIRIWKECGYTIEDWMIEGYAEEPIDKEAFKKCVINLLNEKALANEYNYTEKQIEVLDNAINAIQLYLILTEHM